MTCAGAADPRPSVVVVPARDEAGRIAACLRALAAQTAPPVSFRVLVVLDDCRDTTQAVVLETARSLGLTVLVVPGPGLGPGWARRIGMDLAAELLHGDGAPDGLIASTDADSAVAPDWLERQHRHRERGALAIAGRIELVAAEAAELSAGVLARRRALAGERLREVRRADPAAEHHHFGGASFSLTAAAYRRVGGIEPLPVLEDAAFAERLAAFGIPVVRANDVRVRTSARRVGRAQRGLAVDLAALTELDRAAAAPAVTLTRARPARASAER